MARRRRGETVRRGPTLADVAARAQVSAMTVSRFLKAPPARRDARHARIEEALAALGYVPDLAARALASHRTNVIGVLIPSVTNNVFSDVLRGLYDRVAGSGWDIQLANTRYSPLEEERLLRVFLNQKPAGLIVTGCDQSREAQALLAAAPCPIVQIMEHGADPPDMAVGFSHREAGAAATRHLIDRGYRRIAFLGARMDPRSQRRLEGCEAVLREADLLDARRIVTTPQPSTVTLGCALLAEVLSRAPETDAVFCNNDDLALGVLFEAQRRRIAVPEGLGICGFNDMEMMEAAHPSLTSVRTFRAEMGARAVAMLLERLAGTGPEHKVQSLGFELVARASTRGPG
jgi:LacI family transcriptional regulator, gluconate utilization system Gnt-I transcriptional repressor